jgi:hypothetical protein
MFELLNNDDITIEPRLTEYIEKKKYYERNNIKPTIPLEITYSITREDLELIRQHFSGNLKIYNKNNENKYLNLVEPEKKQFSKIEDERLQRLKIKMERDRKAMEQRNNYSNMKDCSKIEIESYENTSNNMFLENNFEKIEKKYRENYRPERINKKHNEPNIAYHQQNRYIQEDEEDIQVFKHDHDEKINNIIGNYDSYVSKTNTIYQSNGEIDHEAKVAIPGFYNKKCLPNSQKYQPIPYMGTKEGLRDISVENDMKCSYPTKGTKSYGYKNPSEHYFNYITDDIQNPEHVVMPFPRGGISTRADNHKYKNKNYNREIYN